MVAMVYPTVLGVLLKVLSSPRTLENRTKVLLVLLNLAGFLLQEVQSQDAVPVTNPRSTLNKTSVYPKDADLLLGTLFPIHRVLSVADHLIEDRCGGIQLDDGMQPLEMLYYTLDEINRNQTLLPGIKLGAIVLDSCNSPKIALKQSLKYLKGFLSVQNHYHSQEFQCSDGSTPQYQNGSFDNVVGVVAGQKSSVSVQVANVMRLFQVPQISYLSTSASLSDTERYPYFFRTVPSDTNQVEVILKIMKHFKWTYASVVYSKNEYGNEGYEQLRKVAPNYNVCFSDPAHAVSHHDPDERYGQVIRDLLGKEKAKVVVVFTGRDEARKLMQQAQLQSAHDKFVWIGSDAWTARDDVTDHRQSLLEGAIGVQPLVVNIPEFDDYFGNLTKKEQPRNPWFGEFWEQLMDCSLSGEDSSKPLCSEAPTRVVDSPKYRAVGHLHFLRDAVYAFAKGLHNLWKERCKGTKGVCKAMAYDGYVHGQDLYQALRNVTFPDVQGRTFRFMENGDGVPRYTILNYQRLPNNSYVWAPVGNYSLTDSGVPELSINSSLLRYRAENHEYPQSHCTEQCGPGQAKITYGDSCCWSCQNCSSNQFLNETTNNCQDCSNDSRPTPDWKRCILKEEKFVDYKNRWAITAMAFASLGVFTAALVAIIFWLHLNTPVIKAASRELSFILLLGISMSFVMTYVIVAPPTAATCGITRFFMGFSYTISYAAILTKTNRISRIFNKAPGKKQKANYTSPTSQMVIVSLLVSVEVIINVAWLIFDPPDVVHVSTRESPFRFRICRGLYNYSYIIGLVYPLLLVCVCTIYAIKTRKCPGGFNEARYIAFTNYTTCLVWLIFVPLYLSTPSSYDVRLVSLALSLSLAGFVQLGCLFFPKVHIVLFKPEKNTRDAVMSQTPGSSQNRQKAWTVMQHSAPAIVFNAAGIATDGQYPRLSSGELGAPGALVANNGLLNPGYQKTSRDSAPI